MKSVTIRDQTGRILIKVIHRKSGAYEVLKAPDLQTINLEVRDNDNHKVLFGTGVIPKHSGKTPLKAPNRPQRG